MQKYLTPTEIQKLGYLWGHWLTKLGSKDLNIFQVEDKQALTLAHASSLITSHLLRRHVMLMKVELQAVLWCSLSTFSADGYVAEHVGSRTLQMTPENN